MNPDSAMFCLWISWEKQMICFHAAEGFECLPFCTESSFRANLALLRQCGFRAPEATPSAPGAHPGG